MICAICKRVELDNVIQKERGCCDKCYKNKLNETDIINEEVVDQWELNGKM